MDQYQADPYFCRNQMGPDEFVLWTGRPHEKSTFLPEYDKGTFVFAIIFFAITTTLFFSFRSEDIGIAGLILFILPIGGIALMVSTIRRGLLLRKETKYVITNKRIYRRLGTRTDTFPAAQTAEYEIHYHRNCTATIVFPKTFDTAFPSNEDEDQIIPRRFSLENISDPKEVMNALARMEIDT